MSSVEDRVDEYGLNEEMQFVPKKNHRRVPPNRTESIRKHHHFPAKHGNTNDSLPNYQQDVLSSSSNLTHFNNNSSPQHKLLGLATYGTSSCGGECGYILLVQAHVFPSPFRVPAPLFTVPVGVLYPHPLAF